MSCPVSSRGRLILVEDALQGAVFGGFVGSVGGPAGPDYVDPGAGEDTHGVGVVVSAGSGAGVEVGGPWVGVAAVTGEVADRVAELFVGAPAEADDLDLAGLAGRGGDTGEAGQRVGGGEPAAGVADLGEQPSGAHAARPGQAGEDRGVGVQVELFGDAGGQRLDLDGDGAQHGDERGGDGGGGLGGRAGRAGGGVGEALVQGVGRGAAAVADRGQPGRPSLRGEPVGAVLGGEALEEAQADVGVDVGEQPDRAGEADLQVGTQLVGH